MDQLARLVLVGGFLGAGKTTLLARAARLLTAQGLSVGLITNDQAADLVDTALLRQTETPVKEVSGGCFCCRFSDLAAVTEDLLREHRPDILLGEPVGSCTDIAATVIRPMKQFHADRFEVAPFSVLADPVRLREALEETAPQAFPDSVTYIFQKQLEEADIIVINKADLLSGGDLAALKSLVSRRYPGILILHTSARTGEGVEAWLNLVRQETFSSRRHVDVNYDRYAAGEAALGWLNALVTVRAEDGADWRAGCDEFLRRVQAACREVSAEIAHVKVFLTVPGGSLAGNLTASAGEPALSGQVNSLATEASLLVNARVHLEPDRLKRVVLEALRATWPGRKAVEVETVECFSPARPDPTYREGVGRE